MPAGMNPPHESPPHASARAELPRGLGLVQSTSLNIANMVGIGPFITIPAFLGMMQGPQALVAWVIAALVVLCDGLVWSELGAALPGSGGTYHFLSEIFQRYRWGRLLPFLFIWQFLISGTLEMASGYIGAVDYLGYVFQDLDASLSAWGIFGGSKSVAAAAAIAVTVILCRSIRSIGWLGVVLCAGTVITVLTVVVCGIANFNPQLLTLPSNAFALREPGFYQGLGGAMLIAVYDYLGYYNICHLGDEVIEPGKTIPRAVMISVVAVAAVYLTMNIAIIGVVPWQEAMALPGDNTPRYIASRFMEKLYGRDVAVAFTVLILWTVVACMFAITLGYSRIPYAAAKNGGFFRIFAFVHPVQRYPLVSLLSLGGLTALFCYLPLQTVIEAAVTVRIAVQFIGQIVGLHVLRKTRPDVVLPFRMWLYPFPSLVALFGWVFILATAKLEILQSSAVVLFSGIGAFCVWQVTFALRDEIYFRNVISGAAPGMGPTLLRAFLSCLSKVYGLVVIVRSTAYRLGILRTHRVEVPVISIGNVTAGGTGKTPLVAWLAQSCRSRGVKACLLSRGYGAERGALNDEARVLAQLCPDVPHLQNPDRVRSARVAVAELKSQVLILDDGFQHRRLARDLDIVLVDATNPWGFGHLLPRGLLREPVAALRRAHAVVITRVDQVSLHEVRAIREVILSANPRAVVTEATFPPRQLVNAAGQTCPIEHLRGKPLAAFSGIGNPRAFQRTLGQCGLAIAAHREFPDHHAYAQTDLDVLRHEAESAGAAAIVTTQKDLVKIERSELGAIPLWAVQIGTEFVAGRDELEAHIASVLSPACRS